MKTIGQIFILKLHLLMRKTYPVIYFKRSKFKENIFMSYQYFGYFFGFHPHKVNKTLSFYRDIEKF